MLSSPFDRALSTVPASIGWGAKSIGDDVANATFEILKGIRARVAMPAVAGGFDARVSAIAEAVVALENRSGCRSSAERMPCAASEIDRKQGTRQSDTIQLS